MSDFRLVNLTPSQVILLYKENYSNHVPRSAHVYYLQFIFFDGLGRVSGSFLAQNLSLPIIIFSISQPNSNWGTVLVPTHPIVNIPTLCQREIFRQNCPTGNIPTHFLPTGNIPTQLTYGHWTGRCYLSVLSGYLRNRSSWKVNPHIFGVTLKHASSASSASKIKRVGISSVSGHFYRPLQLRIWTINQHGKSWNSIKLSPLSFVCIAAREINFRSDRPWQIGSAGEKCTFCQCMYNAKDDDFAKKTTKNRKWGLAGARCIKKCLINCDLSAHFQSCYWVTAHAATICSTNSLVD
jgi:hypothetical protein